MDGLKFIEKAIKLDAENSEYWYIFAEFLTKLGKVEEADDEQSRNHHQMDFR